MNRVITTQWTDLAWNVTEPYWRNEDTHELVVPADCMVFNCARPIVGHFQWKDSKNACVGDWFAMIDTKQDNADFLIREALDNQAFLVIRLPWSMWERRVERHRKRMGEKYPSFRQHMEEADYRLVQDSYILHLNERGYLIRL